MSGLIRIHGAGGGGSKGGGGTSHVPTEAPDSLHSRAWARVIDCISEGEIDGLVDGIKSIYFDDTPLQAADGSYNFQGVTVTTRNGLPIQDYIPGFTAIESEIIVNTEIKASTPVVRSISNINLSAIRITISIPALAYQNPSNGDLTGSSVEIAIDINNNNGGWLEVKRDTISGKTTSRYQRSYRIDMPTPGPWQIRIRRITDDSTQSNLRNQTYWDSYTEIIDAKLSYPNSALVAIQIDSAQFNHIPNRGYDIRGLRIKVPTNYNPITRSYSGIWDGTFKISWTDNPAWCFYDILTNTRYGLGDYINASQVDKWTLYEIGRYCDELVPDGFGGFEPRFTCNLYLQTREEAYNVIQQMASIFRGMAWWSQGAITSVADMPTDPVALFTEANVIDGMFTYSGSSVKQRHTVALVTWNDPTDMYRQKIEYVEDIEGIRQWGVRETEIVAFGCTSRGQAHRVGRWLLYTERMETDTVSFSTGLESALIYPGAIINIQDASRAGVRMGGRIKAATTSSITLDASVTIEAGKIYNLSCMLPDGSLETRAVSTGTGSQTVLTVSPTFSAAPLVNAIWVLAASDLSPTTWRVVSVSESEPNIVEVTALAYRPDKYAAIENNIILEPITTTIYGITKPAAPGNLTISESLFMVALGVVAARAEVSWDSVPGATSYEISWRINNGNPSIRTVTTPSTEITPATPGTWELSVRSIDTLGRRSSATTLVSTIYGKMAPPADVSGLAISAISGQAHLTFDQSPDLDVIVGGYMHVRHSPLITGASWQNAVDIGFSIPGSATNAVLPLIFGTYLAKWVDSSGNESINATSISTDAPIIFSLNTVETLVAQPAWIGSSNNVWVNQGILYLDSNKTISQQTNNISSWPRLSILDGIVTSGEWISNIIDLGTIYTSRLTVLLEVQTIDNNDTIGAHTDNISLWPNIIGQQITDAIATLYVRTTNDDPNISPIWSSWKNFSVADWTARAYQFRLVLETANQQHNVGVLRLEVTIDMPDRIEQVSGVISGLGTKTIIFDPPFKVVSAIGITSENMMSGDYYQIANRSNTGFEITFYDSTGSPISRSFDWIAKGY